MAQEKARELLTGLAQITNGLKTRAYKVADRLVSLISNFQSGQFTRAMQPGKVDRIPTVGLDPLARLAWDQRRRDNHTTMPGEANCR